MTRFGRNAFGGEWSRRGALSALGALAVSGGSARAAPVPSSPFLADDDPQSLEADDDLFHRMTTPVRLDEGPARAFVVDTGANRTVIAAEVADALSLRRVGTTIVHGIAGGRPAPVVALDRLTMGPLVLRNMLLPILPRADLGADGLLGLDALHGRQVTLDFRARRLMIGRPDDSTRIGRLDRASHFARGRSINGYQRDGQLTVLRARGAGQRLDVFIDTGAEQSIGNLALMALARPYQPPPGRPDTVTVFGATGDRARARLAIAPRIEMEGVRFDPMPLPFADLHTFALWDLLRRPALIFGMDMLRQFRRVSVNLQNASATFAATQPWPNAPLSLAAAPAPSRST